MRSRIGQVWRWNDGDVCIVVGRPLRHGNEGYHMLVLWLDDPSGLVVIGTTTYAYDSTGTTWDNSSHMQRLR